MSIKSNLFSKRAKTSFIALVLAISFGIIIGTLIPSKLTNASAQQAAKLTTKGGGAPLVLDREVSLAEGFSKVVETVGPAVVNIRTEGIVSRQGSGGSQDGLRDFFGDEFFNRFFDQEGAPQERKVTNLGSGVLVDSKGYILTNQHVISGADRIIVGLASGDTYTAELVGEDRQSDLAVLRVDADKPLPFAKIGESPSMKVGDWVLAIGSPFGLDRTVTSGIISAVARLVPTGIFGDYIQTDAPINPGNSGGPLVNMRGEVIGINSFIQTRSGGSNGVGFAIPSTVFVNSYNQLVTTGRIQRGFIGISMNTTPMTPEMAEFFGVTGNDSSGVKDGDGVLVTQLIDEAGLPADTGPAAQAGMKSEDVIVEFNGREVKTIWDLRSAVANTPPGEEVPLKVVRFGQVIDLDVTLVERTFDQTAEADDEGIRLDERKERDRRKEIGIEVRVANSRDLERFGIEDEEGLLVLDVTPGSLADDAGLAANQVITHVNGQPVASGPDFRDKILAMDPGQGVVLRIVMGTPQRQKTINYTSFVKP